MAPERPKRRRAPEVRPVPKLHESRHVRGEHGGNAEFAPLPAAFSAEAGANPGFRNRNALLSPYRVMERTDRFSTSQAGSCARRALRARAVAGALAGRARVIAPGVWRHGARRLTGRLALLHTAAH